MIYSKDPRKLLLSSQHTIDEYHQLNIKQLRVWYCISACIKVINYPYSNIILWSLDIFCTSTNVPFKARQQDYWSWEVVPPTHLKSQSLDLSMLEICWCLMCFYCFASSSCCLISFLFFYVCETSKKIVLETGNTKLLVDPQISNLNVFLLKIAGWPFETSHVLF